MLEQTSGGVCLNIARYILRRTAVRTSQLASLTPFARKSYPVWTRYSTRLPVVVICSNGTCLHILHDFQVYSHTQDVLHVADDADNAECHQQRKGG